MGSCYSKQDDAENTTILPTLSITPNRSLLVEKKAPEPTRDGLVPNADPRQPPRSHHQRDFTFQVFSEAPPMYQEIPETLPPGFSNFPAGVIVILNILKEAAKLALWGHKGAWGSLNDRHGQIWLDSAYTLRPVTRKAILLHATILLLVGKALRSNMTFYFTTLPNHKTEQLSDSELNTLESLMEVFNAQTFLQACELIKQHKVALADQGMETFIENEENFLKTDTKDERLVKLLAFTRENLKGFWHGWPSSQLTFRDLQSLHKKANKASHDQPKLLNNTSFIYQMAVSSYKRRLTSKEVYPVTCTFLLGTRLEPAEVDAIRRCQTVGQQAVMEMREMKKKSFWGKSTHLEPESTENDGSVAKELEAEGQQFCIEAVVFCEQLNEQAKKSYEKVDNFLHGQPDDINDVTFVSETPFLLHYLRPRWIFKTTTSHDCRVDNWVELRNTPMYNDASIADLDGVIWLPSDGLIRRYVFDIVDDASDDTDEDEAQSSNRRTPAPRQDEIDFANRIKLAAA
ncbi:hypothetical protein CABS02_13974 [Colletotrichum abscissum]|uniref:Uncharacterized protein n=1 Tax=Colletotrichum abscissum TaxID=1671311 RepID=A0A9Q0AWI9_9PEZI|nr:hypothetical protein CABS02_13974 [Colletotrichum abscissum]